MQVNETKSYDWMSYNILRTVNMTKTYELTGYQAI